MFRAANAGLQKLCNFRLWNERTSRNIQQKWLVTTSNGGVEDSAN